MQYTPSPSDILDNIADIGYETPIPEYIQQTPKVRFASAVHKMVPTTVPNTQISVQDLSEADAKRSVQMQAPGRNYVVDSDIRDEPSDEPDTVLARIF